MDDDIYRINYKNEMISLRIYPNGKNRINQRNQKSILLNENSINLNYNPNYNNQSNFRGY